MSNSLVPSLYASTVGQIVLFSDLHSNPATSNTSLAKNINAIGQSLDNLFSTEEAERPFQPEYYNPIISLLGELVNEDTAEAIMALLYNKVIQFEGARITIDNASSYVIPIYEDNRYDVKFVFSLLNDFTNAKYSYDTSFYSTITQD